MTANTTSAPATVNPITADFTAEGVTIEGITYAAAYSVDPSGIVKILVTIPGDPEQVCRVTVNPCEAAYPAALEAARAKRKPAKRAKAAEAQPTQAAEAAQPTEDKPTEDKPTQAQPTEAAQPAEDKPAKPAQRKPAQRKPAQRKPAKAQPAEAAQPTEAAKPQPQPVNPAKQAHGPIPEKTWAGTQLQGRGWRIVFDSEAARTRVYLTGELPQRDAVRAIEDAGFFWSPLSQAWQKKLTFRAHRAALELARVLDAMSAAK